MGATQFPNVVLVVLDTARADAFEPYGAPSGQTPTVADMARRGTAVRNVFAPANWTMPSHASLLAGAMPASIGLSSAPGGEATRCKPLMERQRERLVPSVLAAAGFRTNGVSANVWISEDNGFATGFDSFTSVTGSRSSKMLDESRRGRLGWAMEAVRAHRDDGATAAGKVIDGWLADRQDAPFFWFVNLMECHSPYLPPKPFASRSPLRRARAAALARDYQTLAQVWGASAGAVTIPPDALEDMRQFYLASVRHADAWLAMLLERLDAHRLLEDTLVIVTADHGENLGEDGRFGHAFWLDNRLINVPLVTMGPVSLPTAPVTSLADVAALVARAIGLDAHPWDTVSDGVAVAASAPLTTPDDSRFALLAEHYPVDEQTVWRMTIPSTCATDATLKLVREDDEYWLYDLELDPLERAPQLLDGRVAVHYGERLARLRAAVDAAHVTGAQRSRVASASSVDAVPAELEERMRMLGYL